MALYDQIKPKTGQMSPAAPAPKQEQIQKTLQTKATGKAAPAGAGPKASKIGEAAAADQFQVQRRQVEQEGRIQQQQLKQQAEQVESQAAEQKADIEFQTKLREQGIKANEIKALQKIRTQEDLAQMQRRGEEQLKIAQMSHSANQAFYQLAQQSQFSVNNLVADLRTEKKKLASDKEMAEIEQRVFATALRSKEYVQKITQIGNLQRLNEDSVFKEEAMKISMGHRASMLQTQLSESLKLQRQNQDAESKRLLQERQDILNRKTEALSAAQFRQDTDLADRAYRADLMRDRKTEALQTERDVKTARAVTQRQRAYDVAIDQANREVEIAKDILESELKQMKFEAGSKAIQSVIMAGVQAYSSGMFDSAPAGIVVPESGTRWYDSTGQGVLKTEYQEGLNPNYDFDMNYVLAPGK